MSPRKYRSAVRDDLKAETLRRIVDATIALHAEQGGLATTHAQIAQRAQVSTPTVYKYFPTRESLFPACIGKVERQAPPLDGAAILAERDPERRLARLIEVVYRRHAFFAPWLTWAVAEVQMIPDLAKAMSHGDRELDELARAVSSPGRGRRPLPEAYATTRLFLDFTTWQRLTRELGDAELATRTAVAVLRAYFHTLSHKGGAS